MRIQVQRRWKKKILVAQILVKNKCLDPKKAIEFEHMRVHQEMAGLDGIFFYY